MKATITRNLRIGYGLSLFLLIVSSIASYVCIANLLNSSKMVNHTSQLILELENTISILKDAETGQRGYLLTGIDQFLEPYNGAFERAESSVRIIRKMTSDNPVQQKNCDELESIITERLKRLDDILVMKRENRAITANDMLDGKTSMDAARRLVKRMQDMETELLTSRSETLNRFAAYTPVLIILAAILSVIITIVSYLRASKDFDQRAELYNALQKKEHELTTRIEIIEDVAEKISKGDYKTRIVNENEKDNLGSLAASLNKMAESLEYSFRIVSDKEWLQTGIASLNDKMISVVDVEPLAQNIIRFIAEYTGSQVGAFYLLENEDTLQLTGAYSLDNSAKKINIKKDQGVVGQCLKDKKQIIITDIPEDTLRISTASADITPATIIVFPVMFENKIMGVIELGSIMEYSVLELEYLNTAAHNIGIAINTAQSRQKLQELLEETQAQSEELQAQHSELENLNTELEAQTQKLQASEEELKVQQEELLQANQELEERSKALEEKNQLIVERNLDIQKKAEELEVSTKYKSEFLANMSHELRTPLNSILLLSRLLSENNDTNLNDEQIEYAKVINTSGNGLLALIDEILDLSKIEAGKMDLEFADVALSDILSDMKSLFSPIAREKNLEFITEIKEDLPEKIRIDKMRLEQILKNLLSNALKFTSRGSVTLSVSPAKKNYVNISVKDTGIGIPAEKQDHIFEAFQQADGSTRRKYGGTGLGLSISRELAKLLGGEIRLTSEPDRGSEFTVIVPVSPEVIENEAPQLSLPELIAEAFPQKPHQESESGAAEKKKFVVPFIPSTVPDDRDNITENDKIILIVEDDTGFARALLEYTHRNNYKGIIAVRGDEGIDMARAYKPQAILLDIQLPVKDGWEVMEELKGDPQTRHIPVHMMSSMEAKKESLVKGAIDFINKPLAIDEMKRIFTRIEDALNRHPKKVLIIEENPKHAKALAYFLESSNVTPEIKGSVTEGVEALMKDSINCVILDMGIPDMSAYETLETVKKTPGLENLPIIIFTGKNLSKAEESRIKQYADSIVMKTAHSYQRILDEVALFLHLVAEKQVPEKTDSKKKNLVVLNEVLKDKTVLIADDDVRNIFSLSKALEQLKMKVISATDGKEALRVLEENPQTDVVLMDMMMPEMDGYESTALIRRNPKFRNIPILAVTAKAMVGDREKCIKAGASDYISKPVDIDQLISLLRVWLYDKSM
ncbi:response regulator [Pararcticibacter amylolyticus]|uniref:histidine kinase n=1 Tax=Pararcticibacter amylolyticus TaxID=2173175 RepID=A0A2U2PLE3_9SPHI|nr:response regulator [Pararcticibacter amylolyticus]PWG82227.1 histidine kinase [Pararcticibacter amylolyticus]